VIDRKNRDRERDTSHSVYCICRITNWAKGRLQRKIFIFQNCSLFFIFLWPVSVVGGGFYHCAQTPGGLPHQWPDNACHCLRLPACEQLHCNKCRALRQLLLMLGLGTTKGSQDKSLGSGDHKKGQKIKTNVFFYPNVYQFFMNFLMLFFVVETLDFFFL